MFAVAKLPRRLWLAVPLAFALLSLPQLPSDGAEKKKKETVADLIEFTAALSPEDPFAKENMAGTTMKEVRRGETFFLTITGKPKAGYHTYPLTKRTEEQSGGMSYLTHLSAKEFIPLWPVAESEPELYDEGPGIGLNLEHDRPFTWVQEVLVDPDAPVGPQKLRARIKLQVCDEKHCTQGDYDLEVPVTVTDAAKVPLTPALEARKKAEPPPPQVIEVTPTTKPKVREKKKDDEPSGTGKIDESKIKKKDKSGEFKAMGLLQFVWTGFLAGLLSLATPCVFPMIPITVSFFIKQSESKHNSPAVLASVYSGTIVTVLTVGGLVLSTALATVSQHWATNLALGLLFLFFALSLLGMFEIVLPSSLVNFTSTREGQGGLIGTFFMALTFTLISFACVAPFYGSFLLFAASASNAADWFKLLVGALTYSVTFASPFFVLALFPTLLRALPRSGSWMNTIKVVMGFVEVAAAVKFLRSAELAYFKSSAFLTFDLSLGLYVALCLLCGLYLINVYRLPHDYEPLERVGVPRALVALSFLALGLYLTPALFKQPDGESQKPGGKIYEWVEAFLLPDENKTPPSLASGKGESPSGELAWSGQLQKSLKKAEAEKKLVFVDFTAIICTNCRYNERTVFKRPEIVELLGKYELVKLYTDGIPDGMQPADSAEENKRLQTVVFDSTQLPLYVILRPKGDAFEVVGEYSEGLINKVGDFAEFLRRPLNEK